MRCRVGDSREQNRRELHDDDEKNEERSTNKTKMTLKNINEVLAKR